MRVATKEKCGFHHEFRRNLVVTIFTKVSNHVNDITITIADHIRAEEREVTMELATFNFIPIL